MFRQMFQARDNNNEVAAGGQCLNSVEPARQKTAGNFGVSFFPVAPGGAGLRAGAPPRGVLKFALRPPFALADRR